MRGANGIYVAALHEGQLIANGLLRNRSSIQRMVLVPVYPSELGCYAVHAKHRIDYFNGSESKPHLYGFAFLRFGCRTHSKRVKSGRLRAPSQCAGDYLDAVDLQGCCGFKHLKSNRCCAAALTGFDRNLQTCDAIEPVGLNGNIFDGKRWSGNHRNIANNARQPPLVLVF